MGREQRGRSWGKESQEARKIAKAVEALSALLCDSSLMMCVGLQLH